MTPPNSPPRSAPNPRTPEDLPPQPDAPLHPDAAAVDALSPEEQMARFEQDLKESDWGHQPC